MIPLEDTIMRKTVTAALVFIISTSLAAAAEKKAPLSPAASSEATIGGKKISVYYHAPSRRNRVVMGKLVPYGQVWRTGANGATTFQTDSAVIIGTLAVPAGTYSLFTIPGEKEWTLIVNKQTGQWGTSHDPEKDLGRVKMSVRRLAQPVETLAIKVKPISGKNGLLAITWENTEASVPLAVR